MPTHVFFFFVVAAAAVFTADPVLQQRCAEELRTGVVWINNSQVRTAYSMQLLCALVTIPGEGNKNSISTILGVALLTVRRTCRPLIYHYIMYLDFFFALATLHVVV